MPYIEYVSKRFSKDRQSLIQFINDVVDEYNAQGYSLTLRQVYYQLVARDVIPNNERSYKNLGALISDARLAGLIDWNAIEDRTRNLRGNPHWDNPAEIVQSAAYSYAINLWEDQEYYVEAWVEKDALVGIFQQICEKLDINFFSCRGYVSQTEMWAAAQRLIRLQENEKKQVVLLHLGDHDPSGIDMSRDIQDRLATFGVDALQFKRIALNMNQIEEYAPPPNPAKMTDSRYGDYISKHSESSWELDALEPQVMSNLIESHVLEYRDDTQYQTVKRRMEMEKRQLEKLAAQWPSVVVNL